VGENLTKVKANTDIMGGVLEFASLGGDCGSLLSSTSKLTGDLVGKMMSKELRMYAE